MPQRSSRSTNDLNAGYVGAGIGISVGLCLGAGVAVAVQNLAVGMAVGLGCGVACAMMFGPQFVAASARKKVTADLPLPQPLGLFDSDRHRAG